MSDLSMLYNELSAEFFANRQPNLQEWRQLRDAGVPLEALCRPTMVLAGNVVRDRPAGFSFARTSDPDAERAFLIAVEDEDGMIDIAAWQPLRTGVGLYHGRAWALGQARVFQPRVTQEGALPIWRSPLDWLRAGREGVVLIRPEPAAYFLDDAGPLLAENVSHAAELRRMLTRSGPRILVRAQNVRAA